MNGELAQLVALAVRGTAWLASEREPPPTFAGNSAFQFVHSLQFTWPGGGFRRPSLAITPDGWLKQFRDRGGRLLLVARRPTHPPANVPSYQLAGFANGGEWFLHGDGKGGGEAWSARWSVDPDISLGRKPRPADQRIWDIEYRGERAPSPNTWPVAVEAIQARLLEKV